MIVALEPGSYGGAGVRVEQVVLVTAGRLRDPLRSRPRASRTTCAGVGRAEDGGGKKEDRNPKEGEGCTASSGSSWPSRSGVAAFVNSGARPRSATGRREGVPDGAGQPDDVVVGRAGGRGGEGVAGRDGRAVPEEAPERDDQDRPPDDGRPGARVQGGGRRQEGARHPVLLGRHLVARRCLGGQHEAGVRLHPEVRARALHQHEGGHIQRQGVDRAAGTCSRRSPSSTARTSWRRPASHCRRRGAAPQGL